MSGYNRSNHITYVKLCMKVNKNLVGIPSKIMFFVVYSHVFVLLPRCSLFLYVISYAYNMWHCFLLHLDGRQQQWIREWTAPARRENKMNLHKENKEDTFQVKRCLWNMLVEEMLKECACCTWNIDHGCCSST